MLVHLQPSSYTLLVHIPNPWIPWFTNGPGIVSQEGYRQALAVMQQLKERNDSLREKNAELAEEMLVPEAWLRSRPEIFDQHAVQ